MQNKQLLWLGSLVTIGIISASPSVMAQTNLSDVSGGQTFSAPSVGIDGLNGNGFNNSVQFDPATGTFSGGGLETPISFESFGPNGSNSIGTGESLSPDGSTSVGSVDCSGDSCIGNGKPQQVTLNEVADALGDSLEQSLDNLAALENETKVADAGPRRIARRSSLNDPQACGCSASEPRRIVRNPDDAKFGGCCNDSDLKTRQLEARRIVDQQVEEAKKFIEQIDQIKPENNIW